MFYQVWHKSEEAAKEVAEKLVAQGMTCTVCKVMRRGGGDGWRLTVSSKPSN